MNTEIFVPLKEVFQGSKHLPPLVVFKLAQNGRDLPLSLDVTIKRFQDLIECIFGEKSSVLSNIQVKDGCICITWGTRKSAVYSLTTLAKGKITFMKHVGILRLTVGEIVIFELPGMEEDESTLEDL